MNGDSLQLANMIRDLGMDLSKQISDVRSDMQNFHGSMEARVSQVEKDQDKTDKRQWLHSSFIIPINLTLHLIAKRLGLNI